MTKLIFLTDSYRKTLRTKVLEIKQKGDHFEIMLEETIFYPEGGGQPSDKGEILGKKGRFQVTHVRLQNGNAVHEGK
ncbi:MAG: alanine--tRNA ligase-related protein, partial [Patescibacteria group bacterium]